MAFADTSIVAYHTQNLSWRYIYQEITVNRTIYSTNADSDISNPVKYLSTDAILAASTF